MLGSRSQLPEALVAHWSLGAGKRRGLREDAGKGMGWGTLGVGQEDWGMGKGANSGGWRSLEPRGRVQA